MNLIQYYNSIGKLLKEHPEFGKLPVAYSADDEGNSYHAIHQKPTPAKAEDPAAYYLEIEDFFDRQSKLTKEEVNIIIVN